MVPFMMCDSLPRLSEDVQFSDFIQPICLPTILELEQQYTDLEGTIAGWGKTDPNKVSRRRLAAIAPG